MPQENVPLVRILLHGPQYPLLQSRLGPATQERHQGVPCQPYDGFCLLLQLLH